MLLCCHTYTAVSLDCVLLVNDTQMAFDQVYSVMLGILDYFYPTRSVSVTNRDPYFVTPVIKALLRKRNRLMRRGAVAAAESLTKRIIGQRIADQNSLSLSHLHRGSKRMWDQVRRITGKNTTTVCGGPDAAELNQHYANISIDPRYEIPRVKATVSHVNLEFSEYLVFNILDKLKPTATGLDGLPVWFIRMALPWITGPVSHIF